MRPLLSVNVFAANRQPWFYPRKKALLVTHARATCAGGVSLLAHSSSRK